MQDIDESPWDDSPSEGMTHAAEAEWTRLSSGFQNAGYREGITSGKEGALQEGFDTGFAQTGGPFGRELGLLRGVASALLLHLSRTRTRTGSRTQHEDGEPHAESESETGTSTNVRGIVDALAAVRIVDIAPPPPPPLHEGEAEGHAHTHCVEESKGGGRDDDDGGRKGEEPRSPRSAGLGSVVTTIEDVRALRVRLQTLLCESGLKIDLNLEIF